MFTDIIQSRNIYALFSLCNPELIEHFKTHIPNSDMVAAKLIANKHKHDATVCIYNIDNKKYWFELDLETRVYASKGNWIWVKQIDVHFPSEHLLSISIKPRIMDLPYTNKNICAHWLFKNTTHELKNFFDDYI